MSLPIVLMFGTAQHQALSLLFHYLQERGNCRPVFLANEAFPGQPGLEYHLSDIERGTIFPADQEPFDFDGLVSVALDGYFVQPQDLELFAPQDQTYLQSEGWATLIALFGALSRKCLVANHILRRDDLNSRVAMLGCLQSHGLEVPACCVTSDPEVAQGFVDRHAGQIFTRPVAVRELPIQVWQEEDRERLERIRLCPIHLEQHLGGDLCSALILGSELMAQDQSELPQEAMGAVARTLGLEVCEFSFRRGQDGWICTGLYPFFRPHHFSDKVVADKIARFYENGRLS